MTLLDPLAQIAQKRGVSLQDLMKEAIPEPAPQKWDVVRDGPELRRVLALPRRSNPVESASSSELAAFLTQKLAKSAKPYPGPLRPIQAVALAEAWKTRGLIGAMRVGSGKTLTSALLPTVLEAKRPMYVCPANLRDQVRREFRRFYLSWQTPHPDTYTIISYEKVGHPDSGVQQDAKGNITRPALLDRLAPDLIVFDEAHKVSNTRAAVTRRFKRYLEANPHVMVVALSGTMLKRSIKDVAHIAKWALHQNTPLPLSWTELEMWAEALDERSASLGPRCQVGALTSFYNEGDRLAASKTTDEAEIRVITRTAISRRMNETLGFISSNDGPLNLPLFIKPWYPTKEDPRVDEAFSVLRSRWELGEEGEAIPIADGLELARAASALGNGYFEVWRPQPPDDWRALRKEWSSYVRHVIQANRRGWDSTAAVARVIRSGLLDDGGLMSRWQQMEPTFVPNPVATWVSDEAIEAACDWLKQHTGAIWCRSVSLAERMSKELGLEYYGRDGKNKKGEFVGDADPSKSMIVSVQSSGTGRNLQAWNKALWFLAPGEQQLGRHHRQPTEHEAVYNWIYVGCREHLQAYYTQVSLAKMSEKIPGSPQKLCYAISEMPELEEVEARATPRWVK